MNFIPIDAIRHPPDGMRGGCSPSSQEETGSTALTDPLQVGNKGKLQNGWKCGKPTLLPLFSTYSYYPAAPGLGSEGVCAHLTALMFSSKGCHSWGTQPGSSS